MYEWHLPSARSTPARQLADAQSVADRLPLGESRPASDLERHATLLAPADSRSYAMA
jgi:hypothetical protein